MMLLHHHISYIIYHISYIIYHISYIIYHISYVICHMSYIVYRISYIMYRISYIIYRISIIIYYYYNIGRSVGRSVSLLSLNSLLFILSVFRAKRISSNGDKTRVRLSVQKFFKPPSRSNARTHVNVRNCRNSLKFLLSKKMFLVLGSKENGVLKISELMEWKSTYSREIRQYFRNNRR